MTRSRRRRPGSPDRGGKRSEQRPRQLPEKAKWKAAYEEVVRETHARLRALKQHDTLIVLRKASLLEQAKYRTPAPTGRHSPKGSDGRSTTPKPVWHLGDWRDRIGYR